MDNENQPALGGRTARPAFNNSPRIAIAPALVILALATLVRLGTVCFAILHPTAEWPVGAGNEEAVLARSLLTGHGLSSPFGGSTGPTAFVAPGYPILVAGVFRVFGIWSTNSILVVLLLQLVFSVATIAVMMNIAQRVFDARTATIAGVIWAFSLPILWMPTIFWDTCLSTLFLAGITGLAIRCRRHPGLATWAAIGALTGLAGLINPSLLPALFAVMAWCAYQLRRATNHRWEPVLALLIVVAIFVPWPLRNLKVMHAFIPLRSNLGYELWNGNTPGGNGQFIEALHPFYNKVEFTRYSELGEVAYMQEKTSVAKACIEAHPLHFVGLSLGRVWNFWLGLAQPKNKVSGILVLHALLTTLSGAAGLVLLFKRDRATAWLFLLPLLIFPLPYYITHPDLRFRLVVDPLLVILGAYALTQLFSLMVMEQAAKPGVRKETA